MTWEFFYDNYLSWADSTVSSRMSQISDLQYADPEEIVECCQCINDKFAMRLLRKARAAGASFTIPQAIELWPYIDDEALMSEIVKTAVGSCSREELEELNGYVDDETISAVAEKFGLHDPNENAIWKPGVLQEQVDDLAESAGRLAENLNRMNKRLSKKKRQRKPGLFAFLGVMGDAKGSSQAHGFRIGDHVRVKYRGQEGTVVDINGSLIMVSLDDGRHVDSYTASQLEKAW